MGARRGDRDGGSGQGGPEPRIHEHLEYGSNARDEGLRLAPPRRGKDARVLPRDRSGDSRRVRTQPCSGQDLRRISDQAARSPRREEPALRERARANARPVENPGEKTIALTAGEASAVKSQNSRRVPPLQ